MIDTATIFDRLCEYFPTQSSQFLEDIAYIIARDMAAEEEPVVTPAENYYDNALESLEYIHILADDVRDNMHKYASALSGEDTKTPFLDRDLSDLFGDLINPSGESCPCRACNNARNVAAF